jgi:DNA-binding response OmpR family regulator
MGAIRAGPRLDVLFLAARNRTGRRRDRRSGERMTAARVLVVEDDADIALITSETLTASGFNVRHVSSVGEAGEAAQRERFDVAVVDLQLPGTPGWALIDECKAEGVPVVIYSVHTSDPEVAAHARTTADEVVDKSGDPTLLVDALQRILG